MSAHGTPGPWHVNAIDSKRGRIVGDETSDPATYDKLQINGANRTVATVYRPADARLIASAPTLLAQRDALAKALGRLLDESVDLSCAGDGACSLDPAGSWCMEHNCEAPCPVGDARAALAGIEVRA